MPESSTPGPSARPEEGKGRKEPARTPKGMHDVLWPESDRWQRLVERFARGVEGAGYGLVITPVLEHVGIFHRGIGEGSDIVGKEMYTFADRDGQIMALRPEGTASVVRAYVQHHPVPPWKAWYYAPSFRHENPQQGRYRQHFQLGLEALGPADADLDVEVITLAFDFITSLGLAEVTLKLHSMGDENCRPDYVALLVEFLGEHQDELCDAHRTRERRTRFGSSTARIRAASPRANRHRTFWTISAMPVVRILPECAPDSMRSTSTTTSIIVWCAALTTTPGPPSNSPLGPWSRRRTPSVAAAATTASSRCWAGRPHRESVLGSGSNVS